MTNGGRLVGPPRAARTVFSRLMATVIKGDRAVHEATYSCYPLAIGGHTNVVVRRKVPEPGCTLHPSSRSTRLQRNRFSKAAKDWAALTYPQKKAWRQRWEYV